MHFSSFIAMFDFQAHSKLFLSGKDIDEMNNSDNITLEYFFTAKIVHVLQEKFWMYKQGRRKKMKNHLLQNWC